MKKKVELRTNELNAELIEHKKAEKALAKSEGKLKNILYTANEGLLQIDNQGTITYINPEMCSILGRGENQIIGRNLFDFVDEKNAKIVKEQMEIREYGKKSTYELSFLKYDKSLVHCLVNATPLFDGEHTKIGAFAMITDITELKKKDAQLRQAQKMETIGNLAGGLCS